MGRSVYALLLTAVVAVSGCSGWSSSTQSSSEEAAAQGVVRVPKEGNAWIGAVVPRLHHVGLRIAIPTAWGANSFGTPTAMVAAPASGTRVSNGSVVTLQISGLVGMPWERRGHHVVPSVTGATLRKATATIGVAGLPWVVHATPLPPTSTLDLFAAYCVTSQKPAGGAIVRIQSGDSTIQAVELHAKPC